MRKIKELHKDYLQKSRAFLYPTLGVRRGVSVTPIQTFVAWKGHHNPEDARFTCLYHIRTDQEYKNFQMKLTQHELFEKAVEVEDNKIVYIFNFSTIKEDWEHFLHGRYSKLSPQTKKRIADFFGESQDHYAYVHSWLYPEKYFKLYADLLSGDKDDARSMLRTLKEVGELCSPPDLEQETLVIGIKNLEIKQTIA